MASRRAERCGACVLVSALFAAGCASTSLHVPEHDPGNARAPGATVAEPAATLAPGFDPYESGAEHGAEAADESEAGAAPGDHSGHGHH